jgi:FMN-dependent NADH-azoreductase
MKLLHIDSSIQGPNSASRAISAAAVAGLRAHDPRLEVSYRDLAAAPLSHLTLDVFASPDGQEILAEFQAADIIVIGVALYNFSIPSQLKAWLDRILVAGQTFRYGANGPEGLAGDKQAIVALARGNVYGEGTPYVSFEHAETLLRNVFGFIGLTNLEFVIAEGLALGEDTKQASMAAALARAGQIEPLLVPA